MTATIATGTPVPATFANGAVNKYHRGFALAKKACDEDYGLVIFGGQYMSAVDVSSSYQPCRTSADEQPFFTRFVHIPPMPVNDLLRFVAPRRSGFALDLVTLHCVVVAVE